MDEVENQFGIQGKPLGSMNLEELLKSISSAEASEPVVAGVNCGSSSLPLQKQGSVYGSLGKKTVDEVWKEIHGGEKLGNGVVVKSEKETTWGEMTLEDFLTKAGTYTEESSLSPGVGLSLADTPSSFSGQFTLSPAPSMGPLSNAPPPLERKLKRKIKNRESAARSRARKQAYHNELVGKVSRLEMDNIKLKKEKEFEERFLGELWDEKYQLRRTSSAGF